MGFTLSAARWGRGGDNVMRFGAGTQCVWLVPASARRLIFWLGLRKKIACPLDANGVKRQCRSSSSRARLIYRDTG